MSEFHYITCCKFNNKFYTGQSQRGHITWLCIAIVSARICFTSNKFNVGLAFLAQVFKWHVYCRTVLADTSFINGCHTYGAGGYIFHVDHTKANSCFGINSINLFFAVSDHLILIPSYRAIQFFTVHCTKRER